MANLSSAARSASEVVAWLLNEHHFPDAPLKDVRVLLSPVDGEVLHPDVVAKLGGQPAPATRETVRKEFTAFKDACAENTANRAFVFLTGHGIQLSSRGAILLLEDFATPEDGDLLFGAMDVMGCHGSMWETGQADHQVWFSDACRQRPEIVKRFESVTGAWKPGDTKGGDVAATPILLSSGAREQAFADPQGLTLFTDALLWGLRGAGVVGSDTVCPQWHVSTERLSKVLLERVREHGPGRWRHPVDRPDRQVRRRGGPPARRTTRGRHRGLAEPGRTSTHCRPPCSSSAAPSRSPSTPAGR